MSTSLVAQLLFPSLPFLIFTLHFEFFFSISDSIRYLAYKSGSQKVFGSYPGEDKRPQTGCICSVHLGWMRCRDLREFLAVIICRRPRFPTLTVGARFASWGRFPLRLSSYSVVGFGVIVVVVVVVGTSLLLPVLHRKKFVCFMR